MSIWEAEANRRALDSIEPGAEVRFYNRRWAMSGLLVSFEDDSDQFQTQVDGWAKIRLPDDSIRTFRRDGGLGPGGWLPTAKSLRGKVGSLRIELIKPKLRESAEGREP